MTLPVTLSVITSTSTTTGATSGRMVTKMTSRTEDYIRNSMQPALRRQFQPIALRIIDERGGTAEIAQIRQEIQARHPGTKWDRRYPIKVLENNVIMEITATTVRLVGGDPRPCVGPEPATVAPACSGYCTQPFAGMLASRRVRKAAGMGADRRSVSSHTWTDWPSLTIVSSSDRRISKARVKLRLLTAAVLVRTRRTSPKCAGSR